MWESVLPSTILIPRLPKSSGLTTCNFLPMEPSHHPLVLSKTGSERKWKVSAMESSGEFPGVRLTADPEEHFFCPQLCFPRLCFRWEHPGPESCQWPTAQNCSSSWEEAWEPINLSYLGTSSCQVAEKSWLLPQVRWKKRAHGLQCPSLSLK